MTQALMEKMESIEALLLAVNAKIDNFLGFEELEEAEHEEVEELRKEVKSGKYSHFDELRMGNGFGPLGGISPCKRSS